MDAQNHPSVHHSDVYALVCAVKRYGAFSIKATGSDSVTDDTDIYFDVIIRCNFAFGLMHTST